MTRSAGVRARPRVTLLEWLDPPFFFPLASASQRGLHRTMRAGKERVKTTVRPVAFGECKRYQGTGVQRAATCPSLAKCKRARPFESTRKRTGNCGQWQGRTETSITRNHLGGVILRVTPPTQERVACNVTSGKQVNKPQVRVSPHLAKPRASSPAEP